MKRYLLMTVVACLHAMISLGQNYPHYTMFMYNKLIYNPAYAGHLDITNVNVYARKQWVGIAGAPYGYTFSIDGPVGNYMKPFRPVATGLSVNSEKIGVTKNTNVMGYYAYRIKTGKNATLSLGLQAGVTMTSVDFNSLNPYQENDPLLNANINNAILPNVGIGAYYSTPKYYLGFAIPNIMQNYYDKNNGTSSAKQIRTYFLSGGYVFRVSRAVELEPQVLMRYAANSMYNLPFNADLNLSAFFYERLMVGATYRTDKSIEGIIYIQVTSNVNIGYSYDYSLSALRGYNSGTHEVTLGYDFIRDKNKYINPRFIKLF